MTYELSDLMKRNFPTLAIERGLMQSKVEVKASGISSERLESTGICCIGSQRWRTEVKLMRTEAAIMSKERSRVGREKKLFVLWRAKE